MAAMTAPSTTATPPRPNVALESTCGGGKRASQPPHRAVGQALCLRPPSQHPCRRRARQATGALASPAPGGILNIICPQEWSVRIQNRNPHGLLE